MRTADWVSNFTRLVLRSLKLAHQHFRFRLQSLKLMGGHVMMLFSVSPILNLVPKLIQLLAAQVFARLKVYLVLSLILAAIKSSIIRVLKMAIR